MSVTFPEIRVGDPVRYETLSVFPLFAGVESAVEYLLADEGIGSGSVTVEEVSEGPDLLVENKGDIFILFIALESKSDETQANSAEVQEMLGTASGMTWVKAEPVGEGEEFRTESSADVHASALTFRETPVHLSLVTAG